MEDRECVPRIAEFATFAVSLSQGQALGFFFAVGELLCARFGEPIANGLAKIIIGVLDNDPQLRHYTNLALAISRSYEAVNTTLKARGVAFDISKAIEE